jgi:hypothetical protein
MNSFFLTVFSKTFHYFSFYHLKFSFLFTNLRVDFSFFVRFRGFNLFGFSHINSKILTFIVYEENKQTHLFFIFA